MTCSTKIPLDDTIPQNTEGTEVLTVTITPASASNIIRIEASVFGVGTSSASLKSAIAALFRDSNASAIAAKAFYVEHGKTAATELTWCLTAPSTSSQTYKIRVGAYSTYGSATFYVNGDGSGNRLFGGVAATTLVVTELQP